MADSKPHFGGTFRQAPPAGRVRNMAPPRTTKSVMHEPPVKRSDGEG